MKHYNCLSQPVFLQKADETEERNPEEIFRERWGGSDETGPGLDFGDDPSDEEEIPSIYEADAVETENADIVTKCFLCLL